MSVSVNHTINQSVSNLDDSFEVVNLNGSVEGEIESAGDTGFVNVEAPPTAPTSNNNGGWITEEEVTYAAGRLTGNDVPRFPFETFLAVGETMSPTRALARKRLDDTTPLVLCLNPNLMEFGKRLARKPSVQKAVLEDLQLHRYQGMEHLSMDFLPASPASAPVTPVVPVAAAHVAAAPVAAPGPSVPEPNSSSATDNKSNGGDPEKLSCLFFRIYGWLQNWMKCSGSESSLPMVDNAPPPPQHHQQPQSQQQQQGGEQQQAEKGAKWKVADPFVCAGLGVASLFVLLCMMLRYKPVLAEQLLAKLRMGPGATTSAHAPPHM